MGLVLKALGDWFLPTFARFSFAAVLLMYFWNSAKTKLGDGFLGILRPSDNAYIQMFPKTVEALGYDTSQLGVFHWVVAVAGTAAEFVLPLLIVIGLFTRLAAIGMIGFVFVQSIVDVYGHGVAGKDIGGWFDGPSNALILDQRLMWVVVFTILVVKGAGPLSVDKLLAKPAED
jgi:putative oxidoreductase